MERSQARNDGWCLKIQRERWISWLWCRAYQRGDRAKACVRVVSSLLICRGICSCHSSKASWAVRARRTGSESAESIVGCITLSRRLTRLKCRTLNVHNKGEFIYRSGHQVLYTMVKNGAPGNPGEENNSTLFTSQNQSLTCPNSHSTLTLTHIHTHSSWFKENREGSRKVYTRERMMSSR